ncbi:MULTISPECIES: sensor histidine kinase [unclassified Streptomyces]|uniref:sensor histidine kinase n=1 Tax=unclassified Streptomyces TaxID=2593676 RepID=UPI000F6C9966|nr:MULTISPECIES: sensor histidine kinase [unclassified Streptomyces]AZM63694.1 two-component sensor histidine kinase [Streptomyces sp. WAC 01438]RSM94773.1 two-component sensor histidine kinase [Streptomyces sp. WAC 01420]
MDEQRGPGAGPPGRWRHGRPPRWWRHGPPGWTRWVDEQDGYGEAEGDGGGRRPRWPWRSTLLVTVFVLVGSNFAAHAQEGERVALDLGGRILLFVAGALLLWRKRHAVLVLFGTVAAVLGYVAAGYPHGPVFFTVAVACFSAIVSGHRHAAWAAMATFWAGHLLITHVLYRHLPPPGDGAASWTQGLVIATWLVALVAVSELARTRREQWVRERAERAQAARRRADEERLRIARELHDVLAHSISVINVQAGVGLALLDSDPEQARNALGTIKAKSKEALGEVRQVLDTLRAPGAAPRAPAPGLDRLPELVEQARGAGLTVTVEGEIPELPPGADLAAFRIVQEALTNVVRHSGSREARVCVERDGGRLRLRIDDDGPATGADAGGSGNGLAGMRERAAALDGTIEAGPRPDGGFRVLAVLPLEVKEDR